MYVYIFNCNKIDELKKENFLKAAGGRQGGERQGRGEKGRKVGMEESSGQVLRCAV